MSISYPNANPVTLSRSRWLRLGLVGVVGLLLAVLPQSRFWLFTPLLVFGPGYLLERWLQLELPVLARPAIWVGASLALVPLVYLWATAAGLRITPWLIDLAATLLAGLLLWHWWHAPPFTWRKSAGLPTSMLALLGIIVVLTIWTRSEHIAGLVFPPWVDAVHHATIIRVIAEQGQVPYSLRPYLPVDRFAYHWGYHALAATVMNATGLSLPTAMIWLGQVLGVLQVFTISSCAAAVWKRPLAGIIAGIVVGFLSIMPAYFLSWGRYTLLAGLVLLPAVMVVAWHSAEQPNRRWIGLLTLLLAGLLTIHFVAAGFAFLWCAAVWLGRHGWGHSRWPTLTGFAIAGGLAILLVAPWLAVLVGQTAQANGPTMLRGSEYNAYQNAAGLYWTQNNRLLVALALCGALLAIWRRWLAALILVLWSVLVILFANPVWLGLPYLSFFNNNIVALTIFVPFSLLIAGGAAALDEAITRWLVEQRPPAQVRSWRAVRTFGLAALALWYGVTFRSVINEGTLIAQPYDRAALEWAARNTPADARFAINTDGWLYNVARGSDGGWWLLPFAGRQVSTPPVIYTYGTPGYVQQVQATTTWLRDAKDQAPADLARWMRENGYTYAYAPKNGRLFNSQQLAPSPLFTEVYHSDEVSIFALK